MNEAAKTTSAIAAMRQALRFVGRDDDVHKFQPTGPMLEEYAARLRRELRPRKTAGVTWLAYQDDGAWYVAFGCTDMHPDVAGKLGDWWSRFNVPWTEDVMLPEAESREQAEALAELALSGKDDASQLEGFPADRPLTPERRSELEAEMAALTAQDVAEWGAARQVGDIVSMLMLGVEPAYREP